jgi:hypothetical protein
MAVMVFCPVGANSLLQGDLDFESRTQTGCPLKLGGSYRVFRPNSADETDCARAPAPVGCDTTSTGGTGFVTVYFTIATAATNFIRSARAHRLRGLPEIFA